MQPEELLYDSSGYFVFCLSMGRVGNQMEQLLGVLGRVQATNRTLVLPPFISYNRTAPIQLVPVESIFDLDTLKQYYDKIIPMQTFMDTIASERWTDRVLYCGRPPCSLAPEGNPVRPFWNHYGIYNFSSTFLYGSLTALYSLSVNLHPVVAVSSAPAPYPMRPQDRHIAKYFVWKKEPPLPSDAVVVATHIRAGSDWVKACQHGIGRHDYMASPQCYGANNNDDFVVTEEICLPTANKTKLARTLIQVGEEVRVSGKRLLLYVASDVSTIGRDLMEMYNLKSTYDELLTLPSNDPFVDLQVMSRADYLVGNCVSSFTSFAARMRPTGTTGFFGVLEEEQ
jgi:peptide-O-fucosyltransferase